MAYILESEEFNTMTEIILGLIITALLVILAWEKNENKKERARFINALIARTPEQFRDLELTEKVKPIQPPVKTEAEFIPESEVSDKQFEELIKREVA